MKFANRIALAIAALVMISASVSAQETAAQNWQIVDPAMFAGYRGRLAGTPTSAAPDKPAEGAYKPSGNMCAAMEAYRKLLARQEVQLLAGESADAAWWWQVIPVISAWTWQPEGSKFFYRSDDPAKTPIFRQDCCNAIGAVAVIPKPSVPPVVAKVEEPPAPSIEVRPTPEPEVRREPAEPVIAQYTPPDFPGEPEKRGRKFPIPCVPRERTKFGIIVPLAECAGIIAGVTTAVIGGEVAKAAILGITH